MRVLLASYGSRGDVEPLVGFAVALRELGVEARVCVPPDEEFARLLADAGAAMGPFGPSGRALVTGAVPPSAEGLFQRAATVAAGLVAEHFDTIGAAAQ